MKVRTHAEEMEKLIMDMVDFYLYDLQTKFDKIDPQKYYLSYSGGKDSHLLLWFIRDHAKIEGIKVVGINTGMEHPEILARMRKHCDVLLHPVKSAWEVKKEYGSPCFSKMQDEFIELWQKGSRAVYLQKAILGDDELKKKYRFHVSKKATRLLLAGKLHKVSPKCCKYLKKIPASNFEKEFGVKPILGIRGAESVMRQKSYQTCFTKSGKFTPLYDLSDELEDQIYEKYKIGIPKIYSYINRTGCMGCPYGSYRKDTQKELAIMTPAQRKSTIRLFEESYKVLGIDVSATLWDWGKEKR